MSSKWASKFKAKAAKLSRKDSNDQDNENVNDFLYGSGGPTSPRSITSTDSTLSPQTTTSSTTTATVTVTPVSPAAKLDLEDNDNGLGEPLPPENPKYALRPTHKQKGLRVGFSNEHPVLIGEGGDEATLPVVEVLSHSQSLKPLAPKPGQPQVIVAPPEATPESQAQAQDEVVGGSFLNRAPTRKQVGPGFLQKRRSFNMEEGKIQRQSSSTDLMSVAARQGFGASLDPSSAHQALPPAEAPSPPSNQMDKLRQRQESPLPGILRAAVGNIAQQSRDRSKSPAAKKWDELLAHPELKKQRHPTEQQQQQQQQQQQRQLDQPKYTSPDPSVAALSGAAAFGSTPGDHFAETPPADAYGGESASFRRGASPSRAVPPPQQMQQPPPELATHLPSQGEQQKSPATPDRSMYSPISNTVNRLMGPAQDITLSNQWDQPKAYQATGIRPQETYEAYQPGKPPSRTTSHDQEFNYQVLQQQQLSKQMPREAMRPPEVQRSGPGVQPSSESLSSSMHSSSYKREPRLPDIGPNDQAPAVANAPPTRPARPPESQQPTIPDLSQPPPPPVNHSRQNPDYRQNAAQQEPYSNHQQAPPGGQLPTKTQEWRQLDLFPSQPDVQPIKGSLAQRPSEEAVHGTRSTRKGPPPPLHQSPESYHSPGNVLHAGSHLQQPANGSSIYETSAGQRSPRVALSPGRAPPSPWSQQSNVYNQSFEDLSRKSSRDPMSASTEDVNRSERLDVPTNSTRNTSVDSFGRAEGGQPVRSPIDGQEPTIPNVSPFNDSRSPIQGRSPATSVTQSSLANSVSSVAERQQIYESSRGSVSEEYKICVDVLAPAFATSESQARSVLRGKLLAWLRVAAWWNLKGRKVFEGKIKEQMQQQGVAQSIQFDNTLLQAFVDASKAWWITERVLPELLQDPRLDSPSDGASLDARTLQQVAQSLRVQIETFIASITRRRLLPAPALLSQKFGTGFLISNPQLPSVIRTLTSGYSSTVLDEQSNEQPFFSVVLADNGRHFSYGHLYVDAQVNMPGDHEEDLVLPCVVSLIRDRSKSHMEMTITSQDGQVDLRVRADRGPGVTWREVDMKMRNHSVRIQLMSEFALVIRLEKDDFKTLWGMREYNRKVMNDWMAMKDERLVFASDLHDLSYQPPEGQPSPLPSNPIKGCSLRLFEKTDLSRQEENGLTVFNGHRLAIITQPGVKTLSSISHVFGPNFPILHNYLRGDSQKPALMMHLLDKGKPATIIPSFLDDEARLRLIDKLGGCYVASDEETLGQLPLQSVSISTGIPGTPADLLEVPGLQWTDVAIVSRARDPALFASGRFRIASHSKVGTLVDRPVMSPGEIKIGLETLDLHAIKLRRTDQSATTFSVMENSLPVGLRQPLQEAFNKKATGAATIRYKFASTEDLHTFQKLVTGYEVLYDGVCNFFSIKGQRTTAGVHKKLEASRARLQIVQDKTGLQLLVFFKDMPDGACMSFTITQSDSFELSSVGQKFYVRCVDARFGMPKPLSEPDATFVSLDLPEFTGERDDIVIGFDKEDERSRLAQALPATPTKASGLTSLKRFVELGRSEAKRPTSRGSTNK